MPFSELPLPDFSTKFRNLNWDSPNCRDQSQSLFLADIKSRDEWRAKCCGYQLKIMKERKGSENAFIGFSVSLQYWAPDALSAYFPSFIRLPNTCTLWKYCTKIYMVSKYLRICLIGNQARNIYSVV